METSPTASSAARTPSSAGPALISLGSAVLSAFFATGQAAAFLVELGAVVAGAESADFMGPLGIVFRVIAVLADLATIFQTVGEVLASPAIFINQLTLTQTTTVTISHDPDDFQFPSTARNYEVRLVYDSASKVAHVKSGYDRAGARRRHRRRVRRRAIGRQW